MLVQHLTDKIKIYWTQKYIMPQNCVDIDYLLNCGALKLLKSLQD